MPVRRLAPIIGSSIFLVLAPGTVAGYVPWLISRWRFEAPMSGWFAFRIAGVLLIVAGAPVIIDSFARFALQGFGTPAPVFPPRRLVVTGFYRFVRNPMYAAVLALVFGQGLLFGNARLLVYGAAVALGFHLFVVVYEEPALRVAFGNEYDAFRAAVPRWIPHLIPWSGPGER